MSIASQIQRIKSSVSDMFDSIRNKFVQIPPDSKLQNISDLITQIPIIDDDMQLDQCIDGTIIDLVSSATTIGKYAFYGCTALTTVYFSNTTSIGEYAFQNCSNLATMYFPLVKTININAFYSCTSLTTMYLPLATSAPDYIFYNCTSLTIADLPLVGNIGSFTFNGCINLTTLILRKTSRVTLSNINALANTPIANGTGYVYVPDNLVASYKAASNWITYADQILPISQLPEGGDIL